MTQPNVLVSGSAQKSPGDVVRMPMDFGDEPEIVAGVTLVNGGLVFEYTIVNFNVGWSSDTQFAPPLSLSAAQLDYPYQQSVLVGGGAPGINYYLTYTKTLNDPDQTTIVRTGKLSISP